jgi:hypothetical protein
MLAPPPLSPSSSPSVALTNSRSPSSEQRLKDRRPAPMESNAPKNGAPPTPSHVGFSLCARACCRRRSLAAAHPLAGPGPPPPQPPGARGTATPTPGTLDQVQRQPPNNKRAAARGVAGREPPLLAAGVSGSANDEGRIPLPRLGCARPSSPKPGRRGRPAPVVLSGPSQGGMEGTTSVGTPLPVSGGGRWPGGAGGRSRQTINQRRLLFPKGGEGEGARSLPRSLFFPCPATDLSRWIILLQMMIPSPKRTHRIPRAARAFYQCAAACPNIACETEPSLPSNRGRARRASSGARRVAGRIVLRRRLFTFSRLGAASVLRPHRHSSQ